MFPVAVVLSNPVSSASNHWRFMKKLIAAFTIIFSSLSVSAQPSLPSVPANPRANVQSGEITMEQDHKITDSYESQQDKSIEFLKKIQSIAAAGGSGSVAMPEESILSYLNVAYLYCSVTQGTCPQILDSVLEADVINARSKGAAAGCPIMTSFWKLYIRNDMEQRHNHFVKTGFLSLTDDFKRKERPTYIKCKDTITSILADPEKATRYKNNSATVTSLHKAVRMAEELKVKVPNLFISLGAR